MAARLQILSGSTRTVLVALLLHACSAGSGGGGSEREFDFHADLGGSEFIYNGPAPASEEVQGFKRAFYDPLASNDRCGECHTPGKPGSTAFVDQGDVNNAWRQARTVVNTEAPDASVVVQRIANGHNCWLGADQATRPGSDCQWLRRRCGYCRFFCPLRRWNRSDLFSP